MISARTQLYAVIGDPIAHSLSPLMQNWFIQQFGLDAVYAAFHVKSENLSACVNGMKALGIRGLNVTVPHKEAILKVVDGKSSEVQQLGAANTLVLEKERVTAHVTDPYGFVESLGDNRERFQNASVLLFGAGGAAKSVSFAMAQLGVKQLIIHDLVSEKTNELVELSREKFGIKTVFSLADMNQSMNEILTETRIVINATAVGMHPNESASVIEDMSAVTETHFFYDLVYNPGKTRFLQLAEWAGATVQNGLRMLIFQGLQSLRIWTGEDLKLSSAGLIELETIMKKELGIDG